IVGVVRADESVCCQSDVNMPFGAESNDVVISGKVGPFGGVGFDDVVGVDLRMVVAKILEEVKAVVLSLVRQFPDNPHGFVDFCNVGASTFPLGYRRAHMLEDLRIEDL